MLNLNALKTACEKLDFNRQCYVAYSGGVDSHVLLHALKTLSVGGLPIQVNAVHVNHHLSSDADQWATHCQTVCDALTIPLLQLDVHLQKNKGDSLEALARTARYEVIANALPEQSYLLTGHHQDDQAETVLLQLLRGAGPKGLSAMPFLKCFKAVTIARPLLNVSREDIMLYAKEHHLQWIEDSSNDNRDFYRNIIRHDVLPLIKQTWPAATQTLSRTALHCAETEVLVNALATTDLQQCLSEQDTLSIQALQALTPERCKQVIRFWLSQKQFTLPSATKLNQILSEVLPARLDANPLVCWEGVEIRRYRDLLYANQPLTAFDPKQKILWNLTQSLTLPGRLGLLTATQTKGNGIKVSEVTDLLEIRFRQGGETCYLPNRLGAHSLKNLFQEWGLPTWQRDRVPLIYCNDQLVCVFGFCICDGFVANAEDASWLLRLSV